MAEKQSDAVGLPINENSMHNSEKQNIRDLGLDPLKLIKQSPVIEDDAFMDLGEKEETFAEGSSQHRKSTEKHTEKDGDGLFGGKELEICLNNLQSKLTDSSADALSDSSISNADSVGSAPPEIPLNESQERAEMEDISGRSTKENLSQTLSSVLELFHSRLKKVEDAHQKYSYNMEISLNAQAEMLIRMNNLTKKIDKVAEQNSTILKNQEIVNQYLVNNTSLSQGVYGNKSQSVQQTKKLKNSNGKTMKFVENETDSADLDADFLDSHHMISSVEHSLISTQHQTPREDNDMTSRPSCKLAERSTGGPNPAENCKQLQPSPLGSHLQSMGKLENKKESYAIFNDEMLSVILDALPMPLSEASENLATTSASSANNDGFKPAIKKTTSRKDNGTDSTQGSQKFKRKRMDNISNIPESPFVQNSNIPKQKRLKDGVSTGESACLSDDYRKFFKKACQATTPDQICNTPADIDSRTSNNEILVKFEDYSFTLPVEDASYGLEELKSLVSKYIKDSSLKDPRSFDLFVYDCNYHQNVMLVNCGSLKDIEQIEVRRCPIARTAWMESKHRKSANQAWLENFKVPDFGTKINTKLMEGKKITRAERSYILNLLFHAVQPFTISPTTSQYTWITTALLEKFPKLTDIGYKSAMISWKSSISGKFVNARRREAKHLPEVQSRKARIMAMKKIREEDPTAHLENPKDPQQTTKKSCLWRLPNFLPDLPDEESDETINEHKNLLKAEKRKENPNYLNVSLSMVLTFPYRRHEVIGGISVSDIVREYPWITDENEIIKEFARIAGKAPDQDNIERELEDCLNLLLPRLLKMISSYCIKSEKLNVLLAKYKNLYANEEESGMNTVLAVALLSFLLGEDIFEIYLNNDDSPEKSVYIKYNGMELDTVEYFDVIVENETISTRGFLKSLLVFFSCHFAFNLTYAKHYTKILLFLERYIFKIETNAKLPTRVVNVMRRLHEVA